MSAYIFIFLNYYGKNLPKGYNKSTVCYKLNDEKPFYTDPKGMIFLQKGRYWPLPVVPNNTNRLAKACICERRSGRMQEQK